MSRKHKGILFIVISVFCFALMNVCVRMAGDLPSIQKSFFRNLIAFLIAAVTLWKQHAWYSGRHGNMKYLLLRSACGTIGILCNFYAVDHLVLADASMLNKMSPFFAILFSVLILNEKVKPAQALIVLGAFVGSLFVIKPTGLNMEIFPALVGFAGGVGAGAAAAGGQFTITAAYSCAPAREISVYDYSQIIFSAILGFFLFGQVPDLWSWIGYAVIIFMAVVMFLYNNRPVTPASDPRP